MEYAVHEIEPVWDKNSRILILGSFPSVKSREGKFFYHHPQNRFWKVMAAVLEVPVPQTVEEKRRMLLEHHVAVWDVIGSCQIEGSSDSSIRDVVPNDLNRLLMAAPVEKIFTNGATAWKMYNRYTKLVTGREAEKLPSTSPANAAWSLEKLVREWKEKIGEKEEKLL